MEGLETEAAAAGQDDRQADRFARNGMTRTAAPPARPPEPDGPRQVSKFEFNLLRILRFMVGHFPADQGLQLVRAGGRAAGMPECRGGRAGEGHARQGVRAVPRPPGRVAERQVPPRRRADAAAGCGSGSRSTNASLTFSRPCSTSSCGRRPRRWPRRRTPWDAPPQALTPGRRTVLLAGVRRHPDRPGPARGAAEEGRVPPEPVLLDQHSPAT